MTALLIDTSSLEAFIALADKKILQKAISLPGNKELSKLLLPSVEELLTQSDGSLLPLDYIAVCVGPGSFTGTRVGVTVAQALSFATDIPLMGFPSSLAKDLEALVRYTNAQWEKKEFAPIELVYGKR